MYSNNIVNFQESTSILDACTKKSGNLLNSYIYEEKEIRVLSIYLSIYIYIYIYIYIIEVFIQPARMTNTEYI